MQWSISGFFPAIAMASHVSADRNHQTGRRIPLKMRFDVAMTGRMGMELQPGKLSEEDKTFARNAIVTYKSIRPVVQQGDIYRLISPYDRTGCASLMYVAPEKNRAVFFAFKTEHFVHMSVPFFRMAGLDPVRHYLVTELNVRGKTVPQNGKCFTGDFLMKNGLNLPLDGEYGSRVLELKTID